MRRPLFLFLISLVSGALSVSIDNDLVGEPDIECMEHEIRVHIKTRKPFSGRIYAKGKADDSECSKDDFARLHTKKPRFDLPLGVCGMKSLRSTNPGGMYYGVTLVVSFHPLFITKVDQAFHVKCFFEEASKGLTAELGVSMIPTTELEAKHSIPGCTYSIHRSSIDDLDAGKPAGPPIQFSKVGDKVLHQWHCDDQMYGILLKNCYVTDGVKAKAEVIDSRGCPVDQVLITGVRYSDDLQRAYAESSVFKFADRPGVWFFCEIRMCMKKDGMCDGITPPACSTMMPPKTRKGGRARGRGHNSIEEENEIAEDKDTEQSQEEETDEQEEGSKHSSKENEVNEEEEETTTPADIDSDHHYTSASTENNQEDYSDTTAPYPPTTKLRQPKNGRGRSLPKNSSSTNKKKKQFEADSNDQHSSNPYGNGIPSPIASDDYHDQQKPKTTVFGPGISPEKDLAFGNSHQHIGAQMDGDAIGLKPQRSEVVTTDFETNDDLQPSRTDRSTTSLPSSSKKDYVDYDSDVTIPPTLTDLLSNLPSDINAQSVQKMFRDSVADRRALLNSFDELMNKFAKEDATKQKRPNKKNNTKRRAGERIDTMEVSWDSHRTLRDQPIFPDDNVPRIAGQLLIYDLDETPPSGHETTEYGLEQNHSSKSSMTASTCAISQRGLLVMAVSMGSLISTLLFVVGILLLRQYTTRSTRPVSPSVTKKFHMNS
ncbi:Cutl-8 [Aphelenchoides bicaudatus]|nr:Cutl-8 [Aphelenchoides bicaudatus]